MTDTTIRAIDGGDREGLLAFFQRVPEGDRTFFREDVFAPDVVDRWFADGAAPRFAAVGDEGSVERWTATAWSLPSSSA